VVWPHIGMHGDSVALYRDSVAPYSVVWPQMGMHSSGMASYRDAKGLYGPV